jgi:hypothetical protein
MKNGYCSICNSTEVYVMTGKTPLVAGSILHLEVKHGMDWRTFDLNTYMCTNCGHMEMFANRPEFLKTADGWKQVE